jgi:uncharacterized protein YbjQ (UPF0145 family)
MIITTTNTIQGREISEYLGLVSCQSIYTASGIGKFGQKMAGKTTEEVEKALIPAAEAMGADAVVGIQMFPNGNTLFTVGTAVKLK